MSSKGTVSIGYTKTLIETAKNYPVNVASILNNCALDERTFEKPEVRVSLDQQQALWKELILHTGDHHFGLHMGEQAKPGTFDVVGYVMMNCRTLQDALKSVARYQRIIGEGGIVKVRQYDDVFEISYDIVYSPTQYTRHRIEAVLSSIVSTGRWLSGIDLNPLEVHFQHRLQGDLSEYKRVFKSDVSFERAKNGLIYDRSSLDRPISQANPFLCESFEKVADQILLSFSEKNIIHRIKKHIIHDLSSNTLCKESIAKKLDISSRTLQRKLKEEGTSYQEILLNTRKEIAINCLKQFEIPISKIAQRLGFSEPSTFHRAFKEWTGLAPGVYRKQFQSSPTILNTIRKTEMFSLW